jgi:hypothetical protein
MPKTALVPKIYEILNTCLRVPKIYSRTKFESKHIRDGCIDIATRFSGKITCPNPSSSITVCTAPAEANRSRSDRLARYWQVHSARHLDSKLFVRLNLPSCPLPQILHIDQRLEHAVFHLSYLETLKKYHLTASTRICKSIAAWSPQLLQPLQINMEHTAPTANQRQNWRTLEHCSLANRLPGLAAFALWLSARQ